MTIPGGNRFGALLLAAGLGISGGAVAAFLAPGDADLPEKAAPDGDFRDDLDIGIPLENLPDCTGQTLLMVGWGDTDAALKPSVADWDGLKYLEPAKSCDATYPLVRERVPKYVAYLPPFPTPEAACEQRMTEAHKSDFVSRLRGGAQDAVPCACVLDRTVLPAIGEGQEPTTVSGMWIYSYQRMLAEIGLLDLGEVQTGAFDEPTAFATRTLQTDAALNPSGIVDTATWNELRDKACSRYDY